MVIWSPASKLRVPSDAAEAVISAGVKMALMFMFIPAHSPTAGHTRRQHRYQQLVTLSIYLRPPPERTYKTSDRL